jgi:molybdopterin adenylyltransferase
MLTPFEVVSVNLSVAKGERKHPLERAVVDAYGIVGDAHAGAWHRQISLLSQESIERFAKKLGRELEPGEFGENVSIRGVDFARASQLDRLSLGGVELEVTQIGKACHGAGCAIRQQTGDCIMPSEGLFCRVLSPGSLAAGDHGIYAPAVLGCHVITLSDRAARGVYSDRSGPRVVELLAEHFSAAGTQVAFQRTVIADDAEALRRALEVRFDADSAGTPSAASLAGHPVLQAPAELVITTGGTGVGPRDITPDVVGAYCDRLLPGIVEVIRGRTGVDNPRAQLSRAIAGTRGTRLFYTLPGSPRAVEEYLSEILRTLDHLRFMLRGIDDH